MNGNSKSISDKPFIVHLLSRLIHLSLSVHWPVANS
jgi:hypothetical protein